MQVKFKKHNKNATIPKYAHPTDAGMDMTAISIRSEDQFIEYDTGISMEIPEGFVGLLFPRSSVSKKSLDLCNSVGVVDHNYTGTVKFRFKVNHAYSRYIYQPGDKIGQLIIMPFPKIEAIEVDELEEKGRGSNGFGSTDG